MGDGAGNTGKDPERDGETAVRTVSYGSDAGTLTGP